MSEIRTFYLSFCDHERPRGEQFLGACLVDVTEDDARAARTVIALQFPEARDGAEWLAAASRQAWLVGCNPGGQILAADVTDSVEKDRYPRNKLMSRAELEQLGPVRQVGDES